MKTKQITLIALTTILILLLIDCSTTANIFGHRDQITEIYGGIKHLGVKDHKNTGLAVYAMAGKSKSDKIIEAEYGTDESDDE